MPRYVIDETALTRNLEILKGVSDRAGVKILLAQKAFACYKLYPLVARYLDGATASGLFEARLAHEEMPGKENHVFAPAFRAADLTELLPLVNHIVFNSPRQLERHGWMARAAGVSVGLRVNPEVSVATTPAYDPCRPGSRLGVTRAAWDAAAAGAPLPVDGLHFHCLCEQGVEELRKVLAGFEANFGDLLPRMKWVNFGGGHHITRADYDVDGLVALLLDFRRRYPHLTVYLEPGEAVALNAGTLEATVLEIQPPGADGISNVILDVSAACHMPDVLEMPYTPRVTGAGAINCAPPADCRTSDVGPACRTSDVDAACRTSHVACPPPNHVYRFGGPTCLAGDVIGTYRFPQPLAAGDTVVFEDMAIYSMVKNNTFNGMPLPSIAVRHADGTVETLREFGYDDFKRRLG
ncbi:MAG: carboxynorspermidine decarboxylase [Kiritimatiellae bacterium]|nr:carboxynorspermidine decarboxylase [Kiritimatiellia bacterium]